MPSNRLKPVASHARNAALVLGLSGAALGGVALNSSLSRAGHGMTAAERIVLASARTTADSPGGGYWVVDSAGRVTAFGSAINYGSAPAHLNQPIAGIVPTNDGLGYWLVGKDGGVFSFGDAPYEGNALGTASDGTVVGIASKGSPAAAGGVGPGGPAGPIGPIGPAGPEGPQGPQGPQGVGGATGPAGATGATGATGPAGALSFAEFFALAPPDNAATVAPGTAVQFPQDGPLSSSIVRATASTFDLTTIGTYRVFFSVPVDEAGQLELSLNGTALAYTVVGRATGTADITGESLVQTTSAEALLEVINPAEESTALTITPLAGGTVPVSASLIIEQIG
jgi:hypothetical protein